MIDKSKNEIVYIASCSCGKDSVAMVLTLIEKQYPLDCVVFLDTGNEFSSIYNVWDKVSKICKENNIRCEKIIPQFTFDYGFSEKEVKARNGEIKKGYSWCGGRARWMTTLKQKALHEFYNRQFNNCTIIEYIGIAKDELNRVTIKRDNYIKMYPLIYWGMSENDCLIKCFKAGIEWVENNGVNLYQVLDRVSCYCCKNKNLQELKAMYEHLPEYWQKLKDMQAKTSMPFRDDLRIADLEEKFKVK